MSSLRPFGAPGRIFAERFERELAEAADVITTVNEPLEKKVKRVCSPKEGLYRTQLSASLFLRREAEDRHVEEFAVQPGNEPIIFIGRVCTQEGIGKLLEVARAIPEREFWIVGGGPFAG